MFTIEANLENGQRSSTERILDAIKATRQQRLGFMENLMETNSYEQAAIGGSIRSLEASSADSWAHIDTRLDQVSADLSRLRILNESSESEVLIRSSNSDILAKVLRAELKRALPSILEEQLGPHRIILKSQLRAITDCSDVVASGFVQSVEGHAKKDQNGNAKCRGDQSPDSTAPVSSKSSNKGSNGFENSKTSNNREHATLVMPQTKRRTKFWNRAWTFHGVLGVLRITISCFSGRDVSKFGNLMAPEMDYVIQVEYRLPWRLIDSRGISISGRSQRDHRGYLQLYPMLSSFAVVPMDSPIFTSIAQDNIGPLRRVLQNREGSPTDQDEVGFTALHVRESRD